MAEEPNPDDLDIADELIAERRAEGPGQTPEDMTPWQRPITAVIDVLNYRAAQIMPAVGALDLRGGFRSVLAQLFLDSANAGFEELRARYGLGPPCGSMTPAA